MTFAHFLLGEPADDPGSEEETVAGPPATLPKIISLGRGRGRAPMQEGATTSKRGRGKGMEENVILMLAVK